MFYEHGFPISRLMALQPAIFGILKISVTSNNPKYKTPTITDEGLLFWWAHQDLNLGPKDYESRHSR